MSDKTSIWTPESLPPPGYKLIIHRYYTEIVPIGFNVPKTPVKTNRFMYDKDEKDEKDEDDKDKN